MGVEIQLFEIGEYRLEFCLWGRMKSEVYEEKVNTRDELVARIMNSAAHIKQERQDDLRRASRSTIAKRVENCIELLQFIEIIYITNKWDQYVICLSFIPFVRLFMRNIQTTFYLNINQLDALNFIMNLYHASVCFEHKCS